MEPIIHGKAEHTICYRCERVQPDDQISAFEVTRGDDGAPPGHLTGFGVCLDCVAGGDS